jgi:hypothetical protein
MVFETPSEIDILLSCARPQITPERTATIREVLRNGIDWEYLFRIARRHGLMPLLYYQLNTICPESVPGALFNRLKTHFHANLACNLFLTAELLKLLSLFENHGTPAVPFKGPVLASSVYGNLSLREFSDLDILIHKKDLKRAKDLLLSHGYLPIYQLSNAQEAAFAGLGCQFHFWHKKTGINLEMFWEFGPKGLSFPINLHHLWNRLEKVSFSGKEILAFSPEDLLHILCFHGHKHGWEELRWVCDVANLIRSHREMDWNWVIEEAHTLGSERILFLGLYLAKNLLDIDLPDYVWQKVQSDTKIKSLTWMVYKDLFSERNGLLGFLENSLFHLRSIKTSRDRVLYCYFLMIPPRFGDFMFLKLPSSLFFLYYLIRPFRLLGKYSVGRLINSLLASKVSVSGE